MFVNRKVQPTDPSFYERTRYPYEVEPNTRAPNANTIVKPPPTDHQTAESRVRNDHECNRLPHRQQPPNMIISDNLRTASIYINNQLLSRGLLRDGDTIDFAYPGDNDDELAHTMGRIMGVVNDLILRRDVRFSLLPPRSFKLSPSSSTNKHTLSHSATPKPANPSPKPFAPCAPSPSARPPTLSGCPKS